MLQMQNALAYFVKAWLWQRKKF